MEQNSFRENPMYNSCMRELFVTNPMDDVARIQDGPDGKNHLLKGTCSWVNETAQYKEWHSRESHGILWIHGDPGKGKTMLAISQIQKLGERLPPDEIDDSILVCFFCDDKDDRKKDAAYIIQSFLYQILDKRPALFATFEVEFQRQGGGSFTGLNAQQALWRTLEGVLQEVTEPVWFVIDALDECEEKSRNILLQSILERFGNSENGPTSERPRMKWLLTSRNEPLIREILIEETLELGLEEHVDMVTSDVQLFIDTHVKYLYKGKRVANKHQEEIKHTLEEKAEGTFLWVSLALVELRKKSWIHAKSILSQLPKDLDKLYTRLLTTILEGEFAEQAKNILIMIMVALRPLTFFELAELAALPPEYSDDFYAIETVIEECGSLVNVRNKAVYLVHQSVKDFLTTSSLMQLSRELQAEHALLVARGLNYVESGVFDQGAFKSLGRFSYEMCFLDTEAHPDIKFDDESTDQTIRPKALKYPIEFWIHHVNFAGPCVKQYLEPSHEFFQPRSKVFKAWLETWTSSLAGVMYPHGVRGSTPLHVAAFCGAQPLVEVLLEWSIFPVDKPNYKGITPFILACKEDQIPAVRALLMHGVDINHRVPGGKLLGLNIAARHGSIELVKLLVESGADVNLPTRHRGLTALHEAARHGYLDVARMLIERGANVNARARNDYDMHTPLHLAITRSDDRTEMIHLLLDAGADPLATAGMSYMTPLQMAASCEREDYIKLFLDRGGDVNQTYHYTGPEYEAQYNRITPLYWAVYRRNEGIIQLLLSRGAKVLVDRKYSLSSRYQYACEESPAIASILQQHIAAHISNEADREKGLMPDYLHDVDIDRVHRPGFNVRQARKKNGVAVA